MHKLKVFAVGIMLSSLPLAVQAQEYVNADYFSAYLIQLKGNDGTGISARGSVVPNGKLFVELNEVGGAEYGTVGYRHSLPGQGVVVSGFVGAAFLNSNTELDFGVDAELGIGRQGVAHGRYSYQWGVSLGYTYYVNRNMGLRLEAYDGGSALGAVFKF
ncbi:MAG: hypothetical protein OEZ19_01750 [Paracoccaceae bacterium]|nr:hypothetical protein [Paracoccaceae bacterium]